MKIDNSLYDFEEADVSFISIPLVSSKTPNSLNKKGPELLKYALNNKDDYDIITKKNIFDDLKINDYGNAKDLKFLKNFNNQKLFILGGEHTITGKVINELNNKVKDLNVVVFDAHLDVREKGEPNACFLKSFIENNPRNVHLVGQRIYSKEEKDFIDKKGLKINKSINLKNKNLYISFDIDVLDSIYVPTCSTPEPFGESLKYYNDLLIKLFKNNKIVGIDFVEFSGKSYDITYSNIASLIMNLLKTFLKKE